MKRILTPLVVIGVLIFLATPATADWDKGDFAKWAQLPNPNGWDVSFTWPGTVNFPLVLADDFLCTDPIPIDDIHFWVSVQGDQSPPGGAPPFAINSIKAGIWTNEDLATFSRPKDQLWSGDFGPGDFTVRWAGPGQEGFYVPLGGEVYPPGDHTNYYQVNIPKIDSPFPQKGSAAEPIVYWLSLDVNAVVPGTVDPVLLGWKSAEEQWRDDAVVWDQIEQTWVPLMDPATGESLDLAFVITPEPSTIAMLVGAGLIGLAVYGRRRRKG